MLIVVNKSEVEANAQLRLIYRQSLSKAIRQHPSRMVYLTANMAIPLHYADQAGSKWPRSNHENGRKLLLSAPQ